MANTTTKKTTTTRKTTAKKATKAEAVDMVVSDNKETEELKTKNEELMAMIAQMQSQIIALQSANVTTANSSSLDALSGKQIKLVSLMKCPINVSTEADGTGISKTFDKYGDTRTVKFDVLADMVASYPETFRRGLIYIANKEAIEELGLADEYENIKDKKTLDEVSELMTDTAVDIFCEIDKELQESIATDIANNMADGRLYDLNKIRDIKVRTGIDIEAISENIVEERKIKKEHEE